MSDDQNVANSKLRPLCTLCWSFNST